ncbi:MAG: general secretion pathway protein GspK [Anaerohalosphaeraceae bacterium]|nr:general secretion pathway protein GspK [Anaerohalosphaeraceae bacterium]
MVRRKRNNVRLGVRGGVVLVMTMIVLVVLTAIVYGVGSNLNCWRSRQQYMIDYQKARYGCESALKYALSTINELEPNYVGRPNEPDFSDLFTMDDIEYKEMIDEWVVELREREDANDTNDANDANSVGMDDFLSMFVNFSGLGKDDANDGNDANGMGGFDFDAESNEPEVYVRGPYGPQWPYVAEPIEFEFGDCKVRIEIVDENAKLPLNWGISADEETAAESEAAVVRFCEWMQMEPNQIIPFQDDLADIMEIKHFSVKLKPITSVQKTEVSAGRRTPKRLSRRRSSRSRRSRGRRGRTRTVTKKVKRPDIGHTRDFSKIMHSPLLDADVLAVPVNEDEERVESALKYISRWGTQRVNINSAPRHVLEAAFMFGGDSVEIAQEIINRRKEAAFKSVENLKERLYSYNDSIDKCENYICTQSGYYSVRVTAFSGLAKVSAVAGVKTGGDKVENIGLIIE